MRLSTYIAENRADLDAYIGHTLAHVPRTASCDCPLSGTEHNHAAPKLNDAERRRWIMNDEGLYRDARRAGCRI
jgi:hypothetical protein